MTYRRALLVGMPLIVLAACQGGSLTPAQVIADAQGIANGLATALPQIAAVPQIAANPAFVAVIQKAETDVAAAQAALATLSAGMPAAQGAATLSTAEGYLNAVLAAISTFAPMLPPNISIIVTAAAALLPIVETFVNSALGTNIKAAALRAPRMSTDQARKVLHIGA